MKNKLHPLFRYSAFIIKATCLVWVPGGMVLAADCTPNPTGIGSIVTGGCTLAAGAEFTVSAGSTLTATNTTTVRNSLTGASAPSLLNNGTVISVNTPGNGSFAFYNSGNLASLVNNGAISAPAYYVLGNQGTITSLLNTGSITGANGISNYGTISTLTNTGTLSRIRGDFMGMGGITTLNNLQGVGNAAGALQLFYKQPSAYNLIAYSPSSYGQLAISNVYSAGALAFNIYGNTGTSLVSGIGASVLAAGTYAGVLQGFSTLSNVTGTSGTYGNYTYTLVAGSQAGYWDLQVTSLSTNILASNTYLSSNLGTSVNPVFNGGTLRVSGAGLIASALSLQASSGTIDQNGLFSNFSGNITELGGQTHGRLIITNSGTSGAGSVTLSGINTYTGGTEVQAGAVLAISSASALGGGGLDLVGTTTVPATLQTLANVTINNPITVSGDPVFNVASGTTTIITSAIADGSVAGDVVVDGGGTLNLSAFNTYTGPTTVNVGSTLALSSSGSIATSRGVTTNGTLDISTTTNGASIQSLSGIGSVITASGKSLSLTNAADTFSGTISGAGGLTVSGGTETLSGTNTYTGATTISSGATLSLNGSGSVAASSSVAANGVFDISATISGASIKSLSGASTGSVVTASGKSLSLTNAADTFSGTISGAGGVNLAAGTETLSGANTYTGATNVNGGTLNLTGSLASTAVTVAGGTLTNANGGLAAGTNLTVNNGSVNINANDTIANLNGVGGSVALANGKTLSVSAGGAYAGTLSGAGAVQITGGTQTLSGNNTHTGGIEVDAGATLSVASASALGSGTLALVGTGTTSATLQTTANMTIANAITVKNDPTFDVASGTTTTVSGVIADGGAAGYVTKVGAGTLTLTAVNTYSGLTTISAGTLALNGSGSMASSTVVSNNAAFDVTAASSNVALGGTYTQSSTGTLKMNMAPVSNQQVNVAGTATLGGTLSLAAAAGNYHTGRYTLMTSAGLGGSTFSVFSSNLASVTNYNYSLGYDASNVYLYLRSTVADTMSSIQAVAADLNKIYNAQYGIAQLGLSYDCKLFDENNLCLSTGARTTHSSADGSTYDGVALIAAYRAQPSLRLGGWIDQNESRNMSMNVQAGNSTPMLGAFAVWSENPESGEGLEVKVSAAHGKKDLTISRPVIGTSERGQGNSKLSTTVAEATVGYGFNLDQRSSLQPYAGLRYANLSNSGYTENSDVFSSLTFAKTSQSAKSVIAGVKLFDKPEGPIGLELNAGVERYLSTSAAKVSATGLDGLNAVQMTPILSQNRPFVSASLHHDIAKNQQLLLGLSHSKQFANSDWVTSATVRYVIGL